MFTIQWLAKVGDDACPHLTVMFHFITEWAITINDQVMEQPETWPRIRLSAIISSDQDYSTSCSGLSWLYLSELCTIVSFLIFRFYCFYQKKFGRVVGQHFSIASLRQPTQDTDTQIENQETNDKSRFWHTIFNIEYYFKRIDLLNHSHLVIVFYKIEVISLF